MELKELIEKAWDNRELLKDKDTKIAIKNIIEDLDQGILRVAEPNGDSWKVNEWVKKAVILYFPIQNMRLIEVGPFEFHRDGSSLSPNRLNLVASPGIPWQLDVDSIFPAF